MKLLSSLIPNINRVIVADANYTVSSANIVAYTSITATRTVTLPASSSILAGNTIIIIDESGSVSATVYINVVPNGSDTINGLSSSSIKTARGSLTLENNGSGKWTIISAASSSSSSSGLSTGQVLAIAINN